MKWSNQEFNIPDMQLIDTQLKAIDLSYMGEFKNAADLVRQPSLMKERFWLRKMGAVKLTDHGEIIVCKTYPEYARKLKQYSAFTDWRI